MTVRRAAWALALACVAVIGGFAALSGVAAAASPTASASALSPNENDACFACHGQKPQNGYIEVDGQKVPAYIDVNGEKKSIYVDRPHQAHSRHGKLACISCHIGFNAGMHPESVTKDWLRTAKIDACGDCHGQESLMYQGSFHGALSFTKDRDKAPLCADCHDAHNILSPGTAEFRASQMTMCTRCHGGKEDDLPRQLPRQGLPARRREDRRMHRLPRGSPHPAELSPGELDLR